MDEDDGEEKSLGNANGCLMMELLAEEEEGVCRDATTELMD